MKEKIFFKVVSEPSNPPDELAQNVSKNLFDDFFHLFSFESSESYLVFNSLHDSNSICRTGGIISEGFSGGTVIRLCAPRPP